MSKNKGNQPPKSVDTVNMDFTDTASVGKATGVNVNNDGTATATVTATPNEKTGEIVFNTPVEAAPEVPKVLEAQVETPLEEFSQDGKKVYAIRKGDNDQYIFYDRDGKEIDDNTVEILRTSYMTPPEEDDNGGKKVGPLFVREVDDNNQTPEDTNYSGKSTYITERQNYTSGQAWTKTIPIRFYDVVRVLRGEIGGDKKEEESGSNEGH